MEKLKEIQFYFGVGGDDEERTTVKTMLPLMITSIQIF